MVSSSTCTTSQTCIAGVTPIVRSPSKERSLYHAFWKELPLESLYRTSRPYKMSKILSRLPDSSHWAREAQSVVCLISSTGILPESNQVQRRIAQMILGWRKPQMVCLERMQFPRIDPCHLDNQLGQYLTKNVLSRFFQYRSK